MPPVSSKRSAAPCSATVNDSESPLAWLRRRKDRDGEALISQTQFDAGERLRADFSFAQMTPPRHRQLVVGDALTTRAPRRHGLPYGRGHDRQGCRCARTGASCIGGRRSGTGRRAGRRMLSSERTGGNRTCRRLAAARRQGHPELRANGIGASLRHGAIRRRARGACGVRSPLGHRRLSPAVRAAGRVSGLVGRCAFCGCCRVGADAGHHGGQTIGALRCQVLLEAKLAKDGLRIGRADLVG
jgi:hypothetical protein